ncbi:MAG: LamG domain-containing protein [Sedimentisphaerales bacterium]|nr:LamG domain-containing protein [Sedimentisphaerales bacterium]
MFKKLVVLISFVVMLSMAGNASADLVAHWEFDDGSGATAVDSSGNGYDAALSGEPAWVSGQIGGALEFDGTNDYVELPIGSLLSSLTNSTFAIWVDFANAGGSWQRIFDFGTGTTVNMFLTPRMGTDGAMRFAITINGNGDEDQTTALQTLAGGWHHVVLTMDAVESVHSLYLDGELAAQNTSARHTPSALGQTNQNWLGRSQYAADGYFDGRMDDFRIYDRVLTSGQIKSFFNGVEPVFTKAINPTPQDGSYHPGTWANISWVPGDFAISHDIYFGENYDDVAAGVESTFLGNQTETFFIVGFPGFAYPEGLVSGTTYYWRVDEINNDNPESPWKGDVWSFMVPPKTAYDPTPADAAEAVKPTSDLKWTPGFGAIIHYVYFGDDFDQVSNASGSVPRGSTTYDPGTLELAKTYYWRVDEFDSVGTYRGRVWSFTTEGAVGNPNPANGAVDVTQTPVLTWTPGFGATHELYFGTDAGALELKNSGNLGSENYKPGQLEWNTTYYWRVNEANSANADSPWTGPLWSFTTADFLVVDDMESYNDLDPGDPASNRIFMAWVDGFENPTNGSLVGYENPPFAEQTIVHTGNQSMPMYYDNSVGKSEATLTLTSNRDWTVRDVDTLTIWFRGDSGNAAETLYVTLNGTARINNDNPDAASVTRWTQWDIDLQAFADLGVNLTNVSSITLGLGNVTGGAGTMFFDDIRLYPPKP